MILGWITALVAVAALRLSVYNFVTQRRDRHPRFQITTDTSKTKLTETRYVWPHRQRRQRARPDQGGALVPGSRLAMAAQGSPGRRPVGTVPARLDGGRGEPGGGREDN